LGQNRESPNYEVGEGGVCLNGQGYCGPNYAQRVYMSGEAAISRRYFWQLN